MIALNFKNPFMVTDKACPVTNANVYGVAFIHKSRWLIGFKGLDTVIFVVYIDEAGQS